METGVSAAQISVPRALTLHSMYIKAAVKAATVPAQQIFLRKDWQTLSWQQMGQSFPVQSWSDSAAMKKAENTAKHSTITATVITSIFFFFTALTTLFSAITAYSVYHCVLTVDSEPMFLFDHTYHQFSRMRFHVEALSAYPAGQMNTTTAFFLWRITV